MREGQSILIGERWGRLWCFIKPGRAMVVLDDGRKEEWRVVLLESLDQVPLAVRQNSLNPLGWLELWSLRSNWMPSLFCGTSMPKQDPYSLYNRARCISDSWMETLSKAFAFLARSS